MTGIKDIPILGENRIWTVVGTRCRTEPGRDRKTTRRLDHAMWTSLASHVTGPALEGALLTSLIAAIGVAVRPVFHYPYLWRYLKSRRPWHPKDRGWQVLKFEVTIRIGFSCRPSPMNMRSRSARRTPISPDPRS
jgi:hypothetical protein